MSSDAAIDAAEERAGLKNPGYEIFIAAAVGPVHREPRPHLHRPGPDLDYVLAIMNVPITIIFLIDFLYRLKIALRRSPTTSGATGAGPTCWPRCRSSRRRSCACSAWSRCTGCCKEYGARNIVRSLIKDKAGSALLSLLFIAILVLEFGSLLMLRLEANVAGANITSASDAIWYIIVTMSTVGYGDQFPITNPGRVLGTVIIVVGVGIFGTLTGYLANLFLSPGAKEKAPTDLEAKLQELKALTAQQQSAIDELEGLIDRK